MQLTKIPEHSVLAVAHQDDEVLWFSSLLSEVVEVVFCYLDSKSRPQWTSARKKSLQEYPLENTSSLGLDESEVFSHANFRNPVITEYGIKTSRNEISRKAYMNNYYELRKRLESKLVGYANVFTHSPWGEYGNEEHVQVYRAIKELQQTMEFDIWFSNYCSNRSLALMTASIFGFDSAYITLKTNEELANDITDLYKRNGCWTWYDDWEWFKEESFIKDPNSPTITKKYGNICPLNLMKVDFINVEPEKRSSPLSGFARKIRRAGKLIRIPRGNTQYSGKC